MKKMYYLSTCDTCRRILMDLNLPPEVKLQDIKMFPITEEELKNMRALSGSYDALFNKRAKLYRERDLKNQDLTEEDKKQLLMEHYTFLKRPVLVLDDSIFIGNSKNTTAATKKKLGELF